MYISFNAKEIGNIGYLYCKSCSKKLQFGESLTPDIKTLLIHLGIWNQFLNDKHLQSSGNLSSWGEKEIRENNFIFHPNTYGWHIDLKIQ